MTPMPPPFALVEELRQMVLVEKHWATTGQMDWVDAGGRPPGFTFRERLSLSGGLQPATLFVQAYFKPARVPGAFDKLSLSLFYKNVRIIGLDEGGPSSHLNEIGVGRPYYKQRVGHPQIHTVSADGLYGYAEPLEPAEMDGHWSNFVAMCHIEGAPSFELPAVQRVLTL